MNSSDTEGMGNGSTLQGDSDIPTSNDTSMDSFKDDNDLRGKMNHFQDEVQGNDDRMTQHLLTNAFEQFLETDGPFETNPFDNKERRNLHNVKERLRRAEQMDLFGMLKEKIGGRINSKRMILEKARQYVLNLRHVERVLKAQQLKEHTRNQKLQARLNKLVEEIYGIPPPTTAIKLGKRPYSQVTDAANDRQPLHTPVDPAVPAENSRVQFICFPFEDADEDSQNLVVDEDAHSPKLTEATNHVNVQMDNSIREDAPIPKLTEATNHVNDQVDNFSRGPKLRRLLPKLIPIDKEVDEKKVEVNATLGRELDSSFEEEEAVPGEPDIKMEPPEVTMDNFSDAEGNNDTSAEAEDNERTAQTSRCQMQSQIKTELDLVDEYQLAQTDDHFDAKDIFDSSSLVIDEVGDDDSKLAEMSPSNLLAVCQPNRDHIIDSAAARPMETITKPEYSSNHIECDCPSTSPNLAGARLLPSASKMQPSCPSLSPFGSSLSPSASILSPSMPSLSPSAPSPSSSMPSLSPLVPSASSSMPSLSPSAPSASSSMPSLSPSAPSLCYPRVNTLRTPSAVPAEYFLSSQKDNQNGVMLRSFPEEIGSTPSWATCSTSHGPGSNHTNQLAPPVTYPGIANNDPLHLVLSERAQWRRSYGGAVPGSREKFIDVINSNEPHRSIMMAYFREVMARNVANDALYYILTTKPLQEHQICRNHIYHECPNQVQPFCTNAAGVMQFHACMVCSIVLGALDFSHISWRCPMLG